MTITSKIAYAQSADLARVHKFKIIELLSSASDPMTSGEIARRLGLTNVQVSRRLPEIEDAGHIERCKKEEIRPCKAKGSKMLTWSIVS